MTPRHRLLGVFVGIVLVVPMLTAPASSADPVADKKAEAAQIQAQLDTQGQKVSVLAEQSNRANLKVAEVDAALQKAQADLADSDARLQTVKGTLAEAAILAYVQGGSTTLLGHLVQAGKDDLVVRSQYLQVTASDQRQAVDQYKTAKADFTAQQSQLQAERSSAAKAAADAASASKAAAAAEDVQKVALSKVTGELADLVAAAQAQKEAAQAKAQPVFAPAPILAPVPAVVTPQAVAPATTVAATKAAPATAAQAAPAASGKGAIALAEAKKQLGKWYEYGGAGPDTFDCSGLTMWAWRAAGVSLNHSAYDQWFETTRVPVDAVQPGDLVFFSTGGVEGIYHVAMYAGDGNLIEASTTGTPIRIRGWRSADLIGAGRPG